MVTTESKQGGPLLGQHSSFLSKGLVMGVGIGLLTGVAIISGLHITVFDTHIISFLNEFSRRSWSFDYAVGFTSHNHLVKGGALTAMLWWGWFSREGRDRTGREHILSTIILAMAAILVARVLALSLPFRVRPLHNPDLEFLVPCTVSKTALEGWSAWPSDHAALFFALATGLLFVSRSLGALALGYTSFIICLPRIYLGLHYPTDIIGGAFIAASISWLGNTTSICRPLVRRAMRWLDTKPSFFYACLFLLTFQIADMFNAVEDILEFVVKSLR
jgi:undecaprenyl-diphosphatase